MKVICINDKGSKQLIKGKEYLVDTIHQNYIAIHGLKNSFLINRFTDIYGNKIEMRKKPLLLLPSGYGIDEGDSVLCINPNIKSLKYGEIYTIEEIVVGKYSYIRLVKIRGIDTMLRPWGNLMKVPKYTNRNNTINDVLGDESPSIEFYRKNFDKYAKKSMIMNYIHRSMEYLMKTKIENTSVREVFNKMVENNNFIKAEDFDLIKF